MTRRTRSALTSRLAGHVLLDQLVLHGTDMVFGVPGESFLAALDGFHARSDLRFINARQEGGATMMADAYGKLTGRPGVAFATRGPGATNASAGVHVAFQDSTPMILLLGQVSRGMRDREAFQEIDYRRMFGQMAKWITEIDDARRIPEILSHAFYTATSGRPGPVIVSLPEDMLAESVAVADAPAYRRVESAPAAVDMDRCGALLAKAERPLMIVGGGGWSETVRADVEAFASHHEVPVGASFRCQDYVDNHHPAYAGHAGIGIDARLAQRIRRSDLLIVLGARLGEMTTSGYTLLDIPQPEQELIHIHADPEEIGRVYAPDIGMIASAGQAAAALARLAPSHKPRGDVMAQAHAEYLDYCKPTHSPGTVQLSEIVHHLDQRLPNDAIVCNGAGNYTVWVHRFFRYRRYRTGLAPTSGSMGYGVPAAMAAKLLHPRRPVVAFAGDGCFQMTGLEFMTAVQHRLAIIVIVCDNAMYGTIRMHQERHYPERVSGTDLAGPDFAGLARACGGFGATVERTEDFAAAFDRAVASGRAAIVHVKIDPEALTPSTSLTETRARALALN